MKCLETQGKIEEAIKKANEAYSGIVGKTSNLTIGPRLLRLNTLEKGNIFGTSGRVFCTSVPMNKNEVSITIEELKGKGKVGIAICTIDEKGKHEQRADFTLNENKQEKVKDNQKIKVNLKRVEGKWLIVHLDGKSVANTFKYQIFLDA